MSQYGTDPHEMARNSDPQTSKDAAEIPDTVSWEARCHQIIRDHREYGISPKRLKNEYFPTKEFSSLSPRVSALKRKGLVLPVGEREGTSEILVATEYATVRYLLPEEVERMLAKLK